MTGALRRTACLAVLMMGVAAITAYVLGPGLGADPAGLVGAVVRPERVPDDRVAGQRPPVPHGLRRPGPLP